MNITNTGPLAIGVHLFFVEGASIYDFGRQGAGDYWDYQWDDPLFFYSRRIGREPQGRVPSARYRDVPAGAIRPNQILVSKSGMPASAMVGRLGSTLGRLFAADASAMSLPASI